MQEPTRVHTGAALEHELIQRFETYPEHPGTPWPEADFEALALAIFAYQFEGNLTYRRFCTARGATPETVESWRDIPPVVAQAFKSLPLVVGDPATAEATFRTSGTSAGARRRGTHHVRSLALYHASCLATFSAFMLPDGEHLPLVSLVAHPDQSPESSLSHMVGAVHDRLSDPARSGFHFGAEMGVDRDGLEEHLAELSADGQRLLLLGTAFSFVHWLDDMGTRGVRFRLPEGSRVMETGGFKGRSREVPRPELYAALSGRLGLPEGRIVNEYGMTELLSQYYEPVLTEEAVRLHQGPPWLRPRVLDPDTLEEVPPGTPGLVQHTDLANLHSVVSVLTEDLGVQEEGGLRILGRASGAELRGCSLTLDEIVGA